MWIPESLPLLLQSLRKEHRLSQIELARRAGVAQQEISKIERGVRPASLRFLERVGPVLEVEVEDLRRRTGWRPSAPGRSARRLEHRFESVFAPPGTYAPPYQRDFAQRLARLRRGRPLLMSSLDHTLAERPDLGELAAFLAEWPTDSAEEALHVCWLLCLGMKGALLSPTRMGCGGLDLFDWESRRQVGHLLMRSLVLELPDFYVAVWPQVPVRCRDGGGLQHHFRVDNLVGLMGPGGPVWAVVEVDGSGHRDRGDQVRDALLGLPVLRVGEAELESQTCHVDLLRTLKRLYADKAPSVRRRLSGLYRGT